ncbi:MAG TPA: hypothetical protein VN496_00910 [Burkholderiales bacterium]|nr:hypothetical protein [Burkholderiales bacterium]
MEKKTIYSKTGKGVLEIKNKAGKLAKDLVKILTLIDGKSTVADLISKSKFSDAEMNKALSDLATAGYIKEFANTSTGTKSGGAGSYVDDLDFTSSLSPGKNVYQNAQSEWRQRETADRAKAEEEAKQKRQQEDEQKKQEAVKLAREESARLAKIEAERKVKEAAAQKLREEAERKEKVQAEAMAQTQRDLSKKLEAERQAFELAERKKLEQQHVQTSENAARRARQEAEQRVKEEQERRQGQEESRRKEDDRKQAEDDLRRRENDEQQRREEEDRRLREVEERKKHEDEERRQREEDDRKRQEDEARKRREEDELRKREEQRREEERRAEEERKRRDEEQRRHKEEERRRKEEEERVRAEEERKRKDEEARKAREEEEKRLRREEEDRRRREEDERRRREELDARERRDREEAERARRDEDERREREQQAASSKDDLPEFDLSGLRAMESQVAAEFEKQQEALRKREEEEERVREQEEQARLAVERAERQEQAREEAARREAEDLERRERMEVERKDREGRERKRQEEKESRVREQEEAKIKREQERERQDAMKVENERRSREDALVKRRKEQEDRDRKRAEVETLKKQKGIKTPLDRFKPIFIGLVVVAAIIVGGVQVVPMNAYVPSIEKLASTHLKEPVSIGSMHVSILGGLEIILQNVKIGTTQDVKIDKVSLSPEFGSVFGDVKVIHKMQLDSASVAEEVLPRLPKWLDSAVADKALQIERVIAKSIKLESRTAKLPTFDADLTFSPEGSIQKALLAATDGKLNVELVPHDNQVDIALNATKGWVPPLGPQIEFTDLTLKAVANHQRITVEKFESLLYGGAAKGSAVIVWGGPWSIEGEVTTERIELQHLMAAFTRDARSTGQLESNLRYALSSQTVATLFDGPRIEGSFAVKKGDVDGVDLVRALQSGGRGITQGGATRFEEITGTLSLAGGRYQYRNMKLASGLLSATGAFDVSPSKNVSGRITVELRSQAAQIKGNFVVDGDLKAVVLRPN